jgi:hypothetical protein
MGRDVVIESKAVTILVTSYIFTSLAALFVAGRMFSRYRKLGRLAPDDYLILLSLVCTPSFMSPTGPYLNP